MSSTPNPAATQPPRAITQSEVLYFLTDVLKQASEQFHPGKLKIGAANSDTIQLWLREHEPTVLTVSKALLDSHQYISAVKTLVLGYVQAVKAMMFEPASKLVWEKEHPAVLKRRALEAQQSGNVKPTQNKDAEAAHAAKVRQAEADSAETKQEATYEKAVLDLIDRVFFVNPRSQTRDARKIEDLQTELRADIEKARANGHSWGKIHAHVLWKIDDAHQKDERDRVRYNSR
jgi:hypothetical protein